MKLTTIGQTLSLNFLQEAAEEMVKVEEERKRAFEAAQVTFGTYGEHSVGLAVTSKDCGHSATASIPAGRNEVFRIVNLRQTLDMTHETMRRQESSWDRLL
ncbi:hypothetical protein LTR10_012264 [Elasticomyces elasticus]|nr:hypothetical protein LTR10_012264 [Elasticomyces elasticus]KAK4965741.1 hypothetical protein LTR42_011754 [Elasticomyces elasticus]